MCNDEYRVYILYILIIVFNIIDTTRRNSIRAIALSELYLPTF